MPASPAVHLDRGLQSPTIAIALVLVALGVLGSLAVQRLMRRVPLPPRDYEPGPDDWGPVPGRDRDVPLALHRTRLTALPLLLVLAGLAATNTYVGYVPNVAALGSFLGISHDLSSISQVVVPSSLSGTEGRSAFVYLPPGYHTSARRYPVVYLIHGNPGLAADYFRAGLAGDSASQLITSRRSQPVILVAMQMARTAAEDSECLDAVGGTQETTYLLHAVVPFIDSSYRTIPKAGDRALVGFSSGAFCATDIGLHHGDAFNVIGAEQPYADPGASVDRAALHDDPRLVAEHDLPTWLRTAHVTPGQHVYLEAPSDDETGTAARRLQAALAPHHVDLTVRLQGRERHSWVAVQNGFPALLVWASERMPADA